MIDEVSNVIRELDEARNAMRAVLAKVDHTMSIYPGWTVRHVLAHLTGWDEAVSDSLDAYRQGNEATIPAYQGVSEYNEKSVETRRELTFELTVREWEYERERLKIALRKLNREQWEQQMRLPWGGFALPINLLRVWSRHEMDHAREIQELINRSGIIFSDAPPVE